MIGMADTVSSTYPAAALPEGFVYPQGSLAFRGTVGQSDLLPWFFFNPKGETGEILMRICRDLPGAPVPFVSLGLSDGDAACFDGSNHSGHPRVLYFTAEVPGTQPRWASFDDWLAEARGDAAHARGEAAVG